MRCQLARDSAPGQRDPGGHRDDHAMDPNGPPQEGSIWLPPSFLPPQALSEGFQRLTSREDILVGRVPSDKIGSFESPQLLIRSYLHQFSAKSFIAQRLSREASSRFVYCVRDAI